MYTLENKIVCRAFYLILLIVSFNLNAIAEELSDSISSRIEKISLGAHEIDISTRIGKVTLSGWVSSHKDKEQIIESVRTLDGVDEVVDSIMVDEKSPPQIILDDKKLGDARISEVNAAAESYLHSLALKGSYSLQYELNELGVLIKGELPAGTEKQALLYHIRRSVSTPVQENILVRPWPSDSDLAKRVQAELNIKQGLDLRGINISVTNGVVMLKGKRANHGEADQLAAAVLMVEGVRDVKSDVTFDGSRDDPL